MKPYADLLEALVYTSARNGKLALMQRYFAETPDPDRGWALASLTGDLELKTVTPSLIRGLIETRADPTLFRLSYDFVGDLAETASLIWPEPPEVVPLINGGGQNDISLSAFIEQAQNTARKDTPALIEKWLDALTPSSRFALLKLGMSGPRGGMRIGVSARLARIAIAQLGGIDVAELEEIWFGLIPPYEDLFAWIEGRAPKPEVASHLAFRPMMLANPLTDADQASLSPEDYQAEWKWDGIRVQLTAKEGKAALYSRTGDDISPSFPEIVDHAAFNAVLDGELLVLKDGALQSFNDLQQRLGRKRVTKKMLEDYPAHIRAYDILFDAGEDLRSLPLKERRQRLEAWYARTQPPHMDLSPLVAFHDWQALGETRDSLREAGIEGLMLKHQESPYLAGRPKGPWFKWKRDPHLIDCVVMYAQRGHGRRSSFYSDFTFGCWREKVDRTPGATDERELAPVGKAYSGFTDAELKKLDKWVRDHATERFGPVRAVEPGLVFEVAFDAVHVSKRHKSGLAMRFPRIHRIRWDKPHTEADTVETLAALID